jgi:aryl-alcohol dehydrogenase-like predicted oxidoreductase
VDVSLGNTGVTTSALALGCDKLGSTLTPLSRKQCLELLQDAFDSGIRHFDTASIYGQGDSERYIGEAFKHRRDEVCLATKAGQKLSPVQAVVARFKTPIRLLAKSRSVVRQTVGRQRSRGVNYCFDPAFIESSLSSSLRRLQTDRVDIFYLHSPPPEALRDGKLMSLMERLRQEGKIGAIGVSCDDLKIALAAAGHSLIEIIQHDLVDQSLCYEILDVAAKTGKVCLVRGIARRTSQQEGNFEENLVASFRSALALPPVCGVIIGTTNAQHLRQNATAFSLASSHMGVVR